MHRKRIELEEHFSEGSRPGETEYHEVIRSTLNKRDDQFYGKWRPGVIHRTGDVVLYKHALWQVMGSEDAQPAFCSVHPPDEDDQWQSIFIPEPDDDWYLVVVDEDDQPLDDPYMYATQNADSVGIGTAEDQSPLARLEVYEEGKGQYLFGPKSMPGARFTMVTLEKKGKQKNEEAYNYLASGVTDDHAIWSSDAPEGFVFKYGPPTYATDPNSVDVEKGRPLMVVKPDRDFDLVRVGIGTGDRDPEGVLDVTDGEKGQFLMNPEEKDDPVFTIVNLDPVTNQNYLATGVGAEYSVFVTDAPKGFVFEKGEDYSEHCAAKRIDNGAHLVTIQWNERAQPRVGIGSVEPEAMLEITDDTKGQFLFNPEEMKDPVFAIINKAQADMGEEEEQTNYLASGVGNDRAVFVSDASRGFVFKKGEDFKSLCAQERISQGHPLVVIESTVENQPRIGIGTGEVEPPKSMLEITDQKKGQFLFNPEILEDPVFITVNLDPKTDPNYLASGVGATKAIFITDAPEGYAFARGHDYDLFRDSIDHESNESLMVIKKETGNVGIGTEEPFTRLEVNNGINGRFLFNLEKKVNPSLGIVNKTTDSETYFAVGTNNESAVFITDSKQGFEFRKGKSIADAPDGFHPEIDVDQSGKPLVSIRPKDGGEVGICRVPSDYQLDVAGRIRSFEMYLNTDRNRTENPIELGEVLSDVMKLRPITFEWMSGEGIQGKQIGFLAHEVEELFPEVVRPDGELTTYKSIAYQNMVAVAVKAIQEQQEVIGEKADQSELESAFLAMKEMVETLTNRVAELENRLEYVEDKCCSDLES